MSATSTASCSKSCSRLGRHLVAVAAGVRPGWFMVAVAAALVLGRLHAENRSRKDAPADTHGALQIRAPRVRTGPFLDRVTGRGPGIDLSPCEASLFLNYPEVSLCC